MILENQTVVVTGASRGIGAGIALAMARYGANVVVNYRTGEKEANVVVDQISQMGRSALAVRADVTNEIQVQAMVDTTLNRFGRIDVWVNNAGNNPLNSLPEESSAQWDDLLSLNLKSYFLCCRAVIHHMSQRGSGRIINISSISGQRGGLACDTDYSAAKAGIMGLTRSLARWAAPRGILVNAIAPGYIRTDNMFEVIEPQRLKSFIDAIPLGRFGTAEEVGELAVALAGPAGSYLVGEVVTMNGGTYIA